MPSAAPSLPANCSKGMIAKKSMTSHERAYWRDVSRKLVRHLPSLSCGPREVCGVCARVRV
eukprot:6864537-Prymnesium_polylepis.1